MMNEDTPGNVTGAVATKDMPLSFCISLFIRVPP